MDSVWDVAGVVDWKNRSHIGKMTGSLLCRAKLGLVGRHPFLMVWLGARHPSCRHQMPENIVRCRDTHHILYS